MVDSTWTPEGVYMDSVGVQWTLCGLLMDSIRSLTVPVGKCKLQVEFAKTMVKQAQNEIHKEVYITDSAINSIKH
jgi:hypothetical protein